MIRSVGIDLHQGQHRARCLDERAQPCDSFSFQTTPDGLATLEEHIFRDGANPIIVLEPAGLPWLMVAVYLRSCHPDCRLVKAKTQKVAALQRYLRGPVKSDRLDALTLAKMPFIDPEQMDEIYLPPAEIHALQRLTRQRKRMKLSLKPWHVALRNYIRNSTPRTICEPYRALGNIRRRFSWRRWATRRVSQTSPLLPIMRG